MTPTTVGSDAPGARGSWCARRRRGRCGPRARRSTPRRRPPPRSRPVSPTWSAVSSTTVNSGRRSSTCSLTISVPVRAVVIQWISRGSSPATYSRSDMNPDSGSVAVRRISDSASTVFIEPCGPSRSYTRGWTMTIGRRVALAMADRQAERVEALDRPRSDVEDATAPGRDLGRQVDRLLLAEWLDGDRDRGARALVADRRPARPVPAVVDDPVHEPDRVAACDAWAREPSPDRDPERSLGGPHGHQHQPADADRQPDQLLVVPPQPAAAEEHRGDQRTDAGPGQQRFTARGCAVRGSRRRCRRAACRCARRAARLRG